MPDGPKKIVKMVLRNLCMSLFNKVCHSNLVLIVFQEFATTNDKLCRMDERNCSRKKCSASHCDEKSCNASSSRFRDIS